MIALDTNILVRLLTHDDPHQLLAIQSWLNRQAKTNYRVSDIVLVELVWTLKRLYRWTDGQIATAIESLISKPDIEFDDQHRVRLAIRSLLRGADFADALLVESARQAGCEGLLTLDAALLRREAGFAIKPD